MTVTLEQIQEALECLDRRMAERRSEDPGRYEGADAVRSLRDALGGRLVRYSVALNPGARVGHVTGMHELLVVAGRWLIDCGEEAASLGGGRVYDLWSPRDWRHVHRFYGDIRRWEIEADQPAR